MEATKREELRKIVINLNDEDLMAIVKLVSNYDANLDELRMYDLKEIANTFANDPWGLVKEMFNADIYDIEEPVRYNCFGDLENTSLEELAHEARTVWINNIVYDIFDFQDYISLPAEIRQCLKGV